MTDWERCRPWIEAALEYSHGVYEIEDVEAEIGKGEAVFWPGEAAAAVTQFIETRKGKFLLFWLAGGDLPELRRMHDAIRRWGIEQGCSRSLIIGRPGWARVLGYEPAWTTMTKEL